MGVGDDLNPHQRTPDKPKQTITLTYGEATGKLALYANMFRDIKFLEILAEHVGERYSWPRPFTMEMVECGEVGANWRSGKLKICYEMADDFAELYRDYGDKLRQRARRSVVSRPHAARSPKPTPR